MASLPDLPSNSLQGIPHASGRASGFQQLWRLWFSRHNWLTWLGLLFILPLVSFFWQHYNEHLRLQQQAVFQQSADTIEHELQQRLKQMELLLVAKAAFVSASEYVSQSEWQQYIQRFDLPRIYPGIQASGVVTYRSRADSLNLIHRMNQELKEASQQSSLGSATHENVVQLHPSVQHPYVAIVSHIQPLTPRNMAVLGYDMLSDPTRTQTAMRAASLNQAAVTAKILLRQDDGMSRQPGLIMMLPFYQSKLPLATAEQKQQALLGFVYVAFRVKDILPPAWHDLTTPLPDILWASGPNQIATDPDPAQMLFARTDDSSLPPSIALTIQKQLDWYGQPFVLQIKNNSSFESSQLPLAEYELVMLGMIGFILLVLFLSYLNLRRYQAETAVKQLQLQIQQQRQALLQDEQIQSLALKASQLVWFEFDFRTGGAFYSDHWWRMFDFTSPQPNPEPQHLFDLLHAEDVASFRQDLQRYLASGPDQDQQQYRFISRQGRQLFCQVNFYVVRAPEGDAIRLCCSMQDLTIQQQQAQKQQQLALLCQLEVSQGIAQAALWPHDTTQQVHALYGQQSDWLLQYFAQQFGHADPILATAATPPLLVPVSKLIDDSLKMLEGLVVDKRLQLSWLSPSQSQILQLEVHQGWQLFSGLMQLACTLAEAETPITIELLPFQTRLTFKATLQLTPTMAAEVCADLSDLKLRPALAETFLKQRLLAAQFWAAQQSAELSYQQEKQHLCLQLQFAGSY